MKNSYLFLHELSITDQFLNRDDCLSGTYFDTETTQCMLLGRKSVGVDVNCRALALSQKNCAFGIPPALQQHIKAITGPIVLEICSYFQNQNQNGH